MTPYQLAALWLGGDTEMRPRYVAQEFVLRRALRSPVAAAKIVAELNDGSRSLGCGRYFADSLEVFRCTPQRWRETAVNQWVGQKIIDECRRRANGTIDWPVPGVGAAWCRSLGERR